MEASPGVNIPLGEADGSHGKLRQYVSTKTTRIRDPRQPYPPLKTVSSPSRPVGCREPLEYGSSQRYMLVPEFCYPVSILSGLYTGLFSGKTCCLNALTPARIIPLSPLETSQPRHHCCPRHKFDCDIRSHLPPFFRAVARLEKARIRKQSGQGKRIKNQAIWSSASSSWIITGSRFLLYSLASTSTWHMPPFARQTDCSIRRIIQLTSSRS